MTKPVRTIKDPAQPGDNITIEQAREAARKVREMKTDPRKDHIVGELDTLITSWKGEFTEIDMYICRDGVKIFAGGTTAKESRGLLIEWDNLEKMKSDMKQTERLEKAG